MVILTNFENFPARWQSESGLSGESRFVRSAREYLTLGRHNAAAVAVVNCDPGLTLQLAAGLALLRSPMPLVSVDLVLRRPRSTASRLLLPLKRSLLRRVDLFIHYFKDLQGYRETFGIGPERSAFVSFKVNLFGQLPGQRKPDGEYVLCLGRTLRDFDTFFSAMEQLPYPGAIARPDFRQLKQHGARFSRSVSDLPKNIRVLDDDGSAEAMRGLLEGSRLVVAPILKESMAASGCSTCLNAMALGKCVIGTEGPGFSDIFHNGEVICVPPEDAAALAQAIRRVWNDDGLRARTAAAGHSYALAAGGEQALLQRVADRVADWYSAKYLAGTGRLVSR